MSSTSANNQETTKQLQQHNEHKPAQKSGVNCSIKRLLRANKIYFETLVAFALAFMSIIISVNSNKQTKTASLNDKLSKQPNFIFTRDSNHWLLSTSQNIAYNVDLNIVDVLQLRVDYNDNTLKWIEIPIFKLVAESSIYYYLNTSDGVIASIYSLEKDSDMVSEELIARNASKITDATSIYPFFLRYIEVSYVDAFNESRKKYFKYDGWTKPVLIIDSKGIEVFSLYTNERDRMYESIHFSDLDFKNLNASLMRNEKYYLKPKSNR